MEKDRLTHAIIGSIVSWGLTVWTFVETHAALIAATFAIIASCYTISAARQTAKLRKLQQQKLLEDDEG